MSALTPADARASVLEAVGHLQALAIMGMTRQQQDTAMRIASRLLSIATLIDSATPVAEPKPGEPTQPSVNAPTTEWFVYYRQLIAYQTGELTRLHRIENAAMRVASSRRNRVVTDQGPLDALDEALEGQ